MITITERPTRSDVDIATHIDEAQILDTLMLAFAADPVARWIYPDPQQYLTHFPPFVKAFAGQAFEHGTALSVDGFRGVGLWLPPGVHADEHELAALLEDSVQVNRRDDVFALFERMAQHIPSRPHWYLPLLGVDPAHHSRGLGSRLLQHMIEHCDRVGLPAYLEATSARNVSLYRRHGFRVSGMIQFGTSLVLIPMLREPQRARSDGRCRSCSESESPAVISS